MPDFKKSVWITILSLALVLGTILLAGPVNANPDTPLNATQLEGNPVQLSYSIDAYPIQTAGIELETDLVHYGNVTLWTIENLGQYNVSNPDQALNVQKLLLTLPAGMSNPVNVTISGKVPTITTVDQCDGVVITKLPSKTTGFIYYRITTLDRNGDAVGTASTQTFDIDLPAEDEFRNRLRSVSDDQLRNIIQGIHDEGLMKEADTLLSYAEERPGQVPFLYTIGLSILLVIVVGLGGYVVGFRKGKGRREDETGEEED